MSKIKEEVFELLPEKIPITKNHFEVSKNDWEIGYFTTPQTNLVEKTGKISKFDREKEDELVEKCTETILKFFTTHNKFDRRLAKMTDHPLTTPFTKRLYNNIIYTDKRDYFCVGSGGLGGGKAFWTPYTIKDDEVKNREVNEMLGCDNCYIVAHEDQHGIGGHTEFDKVSELIATDFRMNYLPEDMWGWEIKSNIQINAIRTESIYNKKKMGKRPTYFERLGRNSLCSLYIRNPEKVVKIMENERFSNERIKNIISECK